jgi:hypothetical protein
MQLIQRLLLIFVVLGPGLVACQGGGGEGVALNPPATQTAPKADGELQSEIEWVAPEGTELIEEEGAPSAIAEAELNDEKAVAIASDSRQWP